MDEDATALQTIATIEPIKAIEITKTTSLGFFRLGLAKREESDANRSLFLGSI